MFGRKVDVLVTLASMDAEPTTFGGNHTLQDRVRNDYRIFTGRVYGLRDFVVRATA